jgi:hypothetical protein
LRDKPARRGLIDPDKAMHKCGVHFRTQFGKGAMTCRQSHRLSINQRAVQIKKNRVNHAAPHIAQP